MKKITGKQLRMARVALKLRIDDLSKKTGVPWARLQLFERSEDELKLDERNQEIINFFERSNVVFEEGNDEYLPFIKMKR
tara:strand:+ start:357 stop:596 length:240 start_codon:yes stop_codon:yes gene_type:complete